MEHSNSPNFVGGARGPIAWLRCGWLAGALVTLSLSGAVAPARAVPESPSANAAVRGTDAQRGLISVRWQAEPAGTNRWRVELLGLGRAALRPLRRSGVTAEEWRKVLRIVTEQGELAAEIGLPSMLGDYRVEGGRGGSRVVFRPRYPLEPGVSYRAEVRLRDRPGSSLEGVLTSTFQVPASVPIPSTVVAAVYPTAPELPENLLKFYVEFSAPMSGGHIYDHIHMIDDAGRLVELPFLEIDEELWDPSMTRLTLFIDPGRIKREVTPLEEIGPALQAGHTYTLAIDAGWKDARGAPLKAAYRRAFRVGAPIRTPLDPARWTIQPPDARSVAPLIVRFDRSLDWALARRVIRVLRSNANGSDAREGDRAPVKGEVTLSDQEREWRFVPERAWVRGRYELLVASIIEDLAGNNIGKSFEVDLFEGIQRRITNQVSRITFEVQ